MTRDIKIENLNYAKVRDKLLHSGVESLTEKGFSSVGLNEILRKVGVSKGSFNYYFKNKEEFVSEIIQRYDEYFCRKLDYYLMDYELPVKERIESFMADAKRSIVRYEYKRGCLIGNLGQELNTLPDSLSRKVMEVFDCWQGKIYDCLQQAKEGGKISSDLDTKMLSSVFWSGWEGAVLRARLSRSTSPLDDFGKFFIVNIFK